MGAVAALNLASLLNGKSLPAWPQETAIGALLHRLCDTTNPKFSPTNANMGIFPPLQEKIKSRKERNEKILSRGREAFRQFRARESELFPL